MDKDYVKSIIKQTKQMQVLYVEDNTSQRMQTEKMLSNFFDDILMASNGHEGYKLYMQNYESVQLIFTDMRMPMMDGIKMCKKIREMNKLIPIVILSAHDDKELLLDAIKIGIDAYITKPYTIENVTEAINKIIKKRRESNIKYLKNGYYWDSNDEVLWDSEHKALKLSKNERTLVKLLVSAQNKIVSSLDIENEVFDDLKSDNKRVRNLISRFNLKFEDNLIESIYGEGYKISIEKN